MTSSSRYGSRVQKNHLKNGDISYYIVYKSKQKTICQKVGQKSEGITEAKCIELRNKKLSELRNGKDLTQKSSKQLSFDELATAFFRSMSSTNKSNHQSSLAYKKHIKYRFGDVVIANLNDKYITDLQSALLEVGLADSSSNTIVKLVKRIINFGIKSGMIAYSPFKNIRLHKINNTRLRYLSISEIKRLIESTKDDGMLKLYVKIALTTGARLQSVLDIQVKDIDIDQKIVTLYDYKRHMNYTGYLEEEVFNMLIVHIKNFRPNDFVVSYDGEAIKKAKIYKLLKPIFDEFNEGLDKKDAQNRVVPHTLRHTFASHLAINNTTIQKIQELMNHADIQQTMKYAKLMPNSGRIHVEKLYKVA